MARRKHPGGGQERWLITYADMLTLLLAFFIIMYSISKADTQRFEKFQQGMQQAFHVDALHAKDAATVEDNSEALAGTGPLIPLGPYAANPTVVPTAGPVRAALPEETPAPGDAAISNVDEGIAQHLKVAFAGLVPNGTRGNIQVDVLPEGVAVSIYGVLLFDPGAVDLRPDARQILDRVSEELRPLPYDVRVEGHTDSIQPDGGPYASNWEISSARAVSVTRYLIDKAGFAPERMSSAGYAEFRPVASNAVRDGRFRNRRVDLVLIRRTTTYPLQRGGV